MPLLPVPDNAEADPEDDEEDDGEEILGLPSEFNPQELDTYDLGTLASYELKLRIGLAFDLLCEVREGVKHAAANLAQKKKDSRTKKDHLRGQSEINKSRQLGERKAYEYNHNYERIATLRTLLKQPANKDEMEGRLRRIDLNKDLKMVSLTVSKSVGDGELLAHPSWIWSAFDPPKDKRQQASDCAHWHRARMAKAQADAHVNLTCADFRAAIRGLDCMSTCWNNVAEGTDSDLSDGARAYAYQQVHMYIKMRDELKAAYAKALKPGADSEALDHHLVSVQLYSAPYARWLTWFYSLSVITLSHW
ncbi:hypothetical protein K466DRAFT_501353 [Polyporus arcularius HHB13444]|uniref:Uncharacterized protein n=1 Tax=Polyporus arcularius HHB13444 TaxID=1314778 RepID=A0A5C3NZT2_9APHY|nr:hypothetical protein K466DRAFT_501353 [Polyporus arcularius HHB13444]